MSRLKLLHLAAEDLLGQLNNCSKLTRANECVSGAVRRGAGDEEWKMCGCAVVGLTRHWSIFRQAFAYPNLHGPWTDISSRSHSFGYILHRASH